MQKFRALIGAVLGGTFGVFLLVSAFDLRASTRNTNSSTTTDPQKSLYERLGGEAAISAVVDDFAGRVLKDEKINKKFAKSDAPRLLFHLKQQVCAATGGPCTYTGKSMKDSHKNMN